MCAKKYAKIGCLLKSYDIIYYLNGLIITVMKGLLIRIGIDSEFGGWNSPCDVKTNEFLYIPIPENQDVKQEFITKYDALIPLINKFAIQHGVDFSSLSFPYDLYGKNMHMDPDFAFLTYGDNSVGRGSRLAELSPGDFIVFYSSFKPVSITTEKFVYALIGFYVIDEIVPADKFKKDRLHENAHTRKQNIAETDIVIRGKSGLSGRLEKCIPIGEYRNRSYRVKQDILDEWGGLAVKDGFIQRNNPYPWFLDPERFTSWLKKYRINLIQRNNIV
jgi:hypothetical protein